MRGVKISEELPDYVANPFNLYSSSTAELLLEDTPSAVYESTLPTAVAQGLPYARFSGSAFATLASSLNVPAVRTGVMVTPIAFAQATFREPEASKQITFIGIDPGLIVDQVEMVIDVKEPGKGCVQRREVFLVTGSRRQADIEVALLFGVWECVLLVDRNGEHAWVIMEDVRRTVSLMKIAIDDRR